MTNTYALIVRLESYEYQGEFYLIGKGHGRPSEVFNHVAADHILRITETEAIEEYLLEVLKEGENASEAEYEELDADVECWVHVDVYHRLFSFWTGEYVVEIEGEPTEGKLENITDELRSDETAKGQ